MKRLFTFLLVVLTIGNTALKAQDADNNCVDYIPEISLDTRFGYSHDFTVGEGRFGGNGLLLNIDGKISPNFSYSMNHSLASFEGGDALGFGNTNWLTLTYENDYFYVTAGKEDIKVGSFEYDAYDLDSYWEMNSLFWNNCSPWQWGLSAGWYPTDGQTLILQCTNSPYSTYEVFNLFAYALAWRGEWDHYESYWSTNLWQYAKGEYVKSLNLGNRFYAGDFRFDLEYSTRTIEWSDAFTSDFTLMFSPSYEWDWGRAFAKVGWDKVTKDYFGHGFNGSNVFYGAGAEFYPLKEYKDIRLHAIWASNTHLTESHYINVGLTWKMNLTRAGKKLFNKLKND